MTKITQKQLHTDIAHAFVCGSVAQLNTAFRKATHAQIVSVGKSKKWEHTVIKHGAQLTPHKAYLFANTIFKMFGANDLFDVFLQQCAPVQIYLKKVDLGEKPSVVSAVNHWVCTSAIHTPKIFEFLNAHLTKDVAQMHSESFLNENDVWWPAIEPNIMQSIAQLQPVFVAEFQNTVIEILTATAQLLTTLHPIITTPGQQKSLENAVRTALGGGRPYLYALMREHLQEILFGSSAKEDDIAQKIALSFAQAEMHICLIALQTWKTHRPLTHVQLQKIHKIVSELDADQQQKISTYSDIHASNLLNQCQASHIHNQLGPASQSTIRKM